MTKLDVVPQDEAIHFGENEIIVSKTDIKGKITYANDVFCRVAEMQIDDMIGKPHNLIRHPDMPSAVFKLLWDNIQAGKEIFAYVKNMSRTGKYYWVIAHVTPSYDQNHQIIGFHSNRRCPSEKEITQIAPVYQRLLAEEQKHANPKEGLAASEALFHQILKENDKTYSEFVWSLINDTEEGVYLSA